jgi:hypothetical protein
MNALKKPTALLEDALRWVVGILLAYWGLFALLTPVTVWDSHTYNLARLSVARLDGLFGNSLFLNGRQIIFPWSFDSIHLPFLSVEWGYALPSYLSLTGIAWIVFQILHRTVGSRTAWLGVFALFAMPTVIFQATSTKNDLGLVFVAIFAAYALFRYCEKMNSQWLLLSAVAVGFLPGIKSTGIALAFFLTVGTIWVLRRNIRTLASWFAAAALSFCLLGSLEIYINNVLLYANPLGNTGLVRHLSNQDGPAGALANLIRYVFGFINPGWPVDPIWSRNLEAASRAVLEVLGLTGQGLHSNYSEATVIFLRNGGETGSNFGPLGAATMAISAWLVIRFRRNQHACWIALAGWVLLGATAFTVPWMEWNMRFLMLPAILFVAAALMALAPYIEQKWWVFTGVFLVLLYSAIVFPLSSFNKHPVDLVNAVQNRERQTLRERPTMQEVFDAVREMNSVYPDRPWLLHVGLDSWVLGLLEMSEVNFRPEPVLDTQDLNTASAGSESGSVMILVLNRDISPEMASSMVRIARLKREKKTAIYTWLPETSIQSAKAAGFSIAHEDLMISVGDLKVKATQNGRKFKSGLFLLVLDEEGNVVDTIFSVDFDELLTTLEGRMVIGVSIHAEGSEYDNQFFFGRMSSDLARLRVQPLKSDVYISAAELNF